jgi:hypothetical protein
MTELNTYPKDWKKIVARVRDRAGNRCQDAALDQAKPILARADKSFPIENLNAWEKEQRKLACGV